MDNNNLHYVYKTLDLLLTKAGVSGKLKNATIRIPHQELVQVVGGKEWDPQLELILTLDLEWSDTNGTDETETTN